MRLKSIFISDYKNLKDFTLAFEGDSFIDIFVGKNGSGKSNLLEALIEIFQHILSFDSDRSDLLFNYCVKYEIKGKDVEIRWQDETLSINGKFRNSIGKTPTPENILVYYSGHNDSVKKVIEQYETKFRKRIKAASADESRRLIGIGPEYKELLLAAMLMQKDDCIARHFIKQKLGINQLGLERPGTKERTEPLLKLVLDRPEYAGGTQRTSFDIDDNDETDRYWKPKGITKDFLDQLHSCINSAPGGLTVTNGYLSADDQYVLYLDIAKIQDNFKDFTPQELFRQFDNLKTLGMLTEISVPLALEGDVNANITHFSDGQFQSVYIYAITELFKDKDCITLLDEPDAFLHPEWQFEYLKQVVEISEQAAKTNHILMSSHSASTIATADESTINLFDFNGDKVVVNKVNKSEVIKSLSAGLISFTEGEARLNIHHVLKNTSGPVLFTEGITDEMILETAWEKLYPCEKRPFEVQGAYDRIFLRNLFSRDELGENYPNRVMIALFDFDDAYDDWNGLKAKEKGVLIEADPMKGLCKQLKCLDHYAILLPVPNIDSIKPQILDEDGKPWGRGSDSYLPIEVLFYKDEWLDKWFKKRALPGGGEIIEFSGDKVKFSKEVIPNIDLDYFEVFRPLFAFIKSKCFPVQAVT